MGLKEKIADDMKSAMKSKDQLRLETLRMLRAGLLEKEIEKRGSGTPMSPEDELGVLAAAVKKRRESMELFEKGGRMELVEQEGKEIAVIQEYLPRPLTPEEVAGVVREVIAETGASTPADFGKVMSPAMKRLKGKADGALVQELVKKLLGGG